MRKLTNQPSQWLKETPSQIQTASRVAMILFGATVVVVLFYFFLAFQLGAWQMFSLVGVISAFGVVTFLSIGLIRRERPVLGLWLIIGGLLLIFPIASALVANVGLILGLALILLIVSITLATQILPRRQSRMAIAASFLVGIVTLLLDVFGKNVSLLSYRLTVPDLQTFLPAITGLVLLAYGFIILRQFRDYTLRTKFILTFLAITLIPLGLLAVSNNYNTRQQLVADANQRLSAGAKQTAASIDAFINSNLNTTQAEARIPEFVEYLSPTPNPDSDNDPTPILTSLSWKDPSYISSYALLDRRGIDVADNFSQDIGLSKADRDYFRVPLETGQPFVSPVQFSPSTGRAALYFSSPVRAATDEIIGILRVRYDADVLQQLISPSTGLAGEESFAVLFDENHIHLAHSTTPEVIFKATGPLDLTRAAALKAARRLPQLPIEQLSTNLPNLDRNLANASNEPFFTAMDIATGNQVNQVAVISLETQPWSVAFFQPREVFLRPIEDQTRNTAFLAAGIGIVVVLTAVFVSQRLSSPITQLTTVAQQVAGGNLSVQSPVESRDETGQLARAFNSMTTQLRNLIGSLEDQVRDRTEELALSIQVGQRASAIRDLDKLLPTVTEFIRERFDLYYTHVYFVDDIGQNLVIKAGTGEVGKELLARRHSLPVGVGSIVGRVAATGQPIVVPDTENSDIHRPNPLLPRTRSELAVPLIFEERVIGVLDMQASRANAFTENNMPVFEAMATQLAIAIDGAQQWAAAQEARRKLEQALKQLTHETWGSTLASQKEDLAFTYDLSAVTPLRAKSLEASNSEPNGELMVPLVVQNESIGHLRVEMPSKRSWSNDERDFLEAVVQQLAQKAETLRLFEDTQQRAMREQIARQIVDKIRASRNIETALKTAVEGLTIALGTARGVIDLKVAQVAKEDISTKEIDP